VQEEKIATENVTYLFATKSCPNCRTAKSILDGAGVNYHIVNAEENEALVHKYNVMHAPTLIVVNGGVISRYPNASNIKKYTEGKK
jgi:glutaredoxin